MFSAFSRFLVLAALASPALCQIPAVPITASFSSNVKGVQASAPTASITITLSRAGNAPRLDLPLTWNFGDNTFRASDVATFPAGAKTTVVSANLLKIGSGGPVTLSMKLPGGGTANSGILFAIPRPLKK